MIPKKILLCTDFSENSLPARLKAIEYARTFGAELCILHVVDSAPLGYPIFAEKIPIDLASFQETIQEGVEKELEALARECEAELNAVKAYFRVGNPAAEIVRFAQEESADLIVVGTHGWTGFKHLVLGSTAENVVRMSKVPVLTVRAAG